MRVETRERPATEYYNIYIAEDGTEFDTRRACENYEFKLAENKYNLPHKQLTDPNGEPVTIWYIKSQEEFDWLKKTEWTHCTIYGEFEKEGWYVTFFNDGGDYSDSYDIMLLDEYVNTIKSYFQEILDLTTPEIVI